MRFFKVRRPDNDRDRYCIEAAHEFALPGAHCDICAETWGSVGLCYPQVQPPAGVDTSPFEVPRPEPVDEFLRLAELARPLFPDGALLRPGTQFGALDGRAEGSGWSDFAWEVLWGLLVTPDTMTALNKRFPELVAGPTRLTASGQPLDYLELFVPAMGRIAARVLDPPDAPVCPRCGRRPGRLADDVAILAEPGLESVPLFRLADFPTALIASEPFVAVVQELSLHGLEFKVVAIDE
jgi:uncharacterized double-CXXCG motif protein